MTFSPPPPLLYVSATTRVISAADGTPELSVSALLRNGTIVPIDVAHGAKCPLSVALFPDPSGEEVDSLSGPSECAANSPMLALAPGDTAVLTRVLSADSLASFAPGTYAVNVAINTSTATIGVWAGAVQLPLASP